MLLSIHVHNNIYNVIQYTQIITDVRSLSNTFNELTIPYRYTSTKDNICTQISIYNIPK